MISIDSLPPAMRRRLLAASDRVHKAERTLDAARMATERPDASWKDVKAYWDAETEMEAASIYWRKTDRAARRTLPAGA